MSRRNQTQKTGISSKAAINQIKIESLPYFSFSGDSDIIPYGTDNLYPNRIIEAIKKSPTAKGCVKREAEFIFGHGINQDVIVNRHGETLNDIINQSIFHGYSPLGGFGIHMNFNLLGDIPEMFFVSNEYIRKNRNLRSVEYGIWNEGTNAVFLNENVTVDIYSPDHFMDQVINAGGFRNYKGACSLFSKDLGVYPTAPIDAASISASFEKEAQIYPYANIKNGVSGNTLIKVPTMSNGEKAAKEIDGLEEKLCDIHGAEKAGSSVVVTVPMNMQGEAKAFNMIEHLSPTDVDDLFEKQNQKAENNIQKCYTMPDILIGISTKGMFNEASFYDAFNYKNADTESDRKAIERFFNKLLPNSVFGIDSIELRPLEMKGKQEESITIQKETPSGGSIEIEKEQEDIQGESQAALRGSVGGVQGVLDIQKSFAEGTTSKESALAILTIIFGFTRAQALELLGQPKEVTESESSLSDVGLSVIQSYQFGDWEKPRAIKALINVLKIEEETAEELLNHKFE